MTNKIYPRNLTARAAYDVVGNPANTRLESGVANCFPGLEFDVRNLDNRFFPGLLFQFLPTPLSLVPEAPRNVQGCRLVYVDFLEDPALDQTDGTPWVQKLISAYKGDIGSQLSTGDRWYLEWVEQGGRRISMSDPSGTPYDGLTTWWLVRVLEAEPPLTISLVSRDHAGNDVAPSVVLEGRRRRYVNSAGVVDAVYRAGELTQSLCNPWTHDFRDCGCHYWASNHPDIVTATIPGQTLPSGASSDAEKAVTYLDWLRADRGPAGQTAARATIFQARPDQIDHYEINRLWERLPFVLGGREIGDVYTREADPTAQPYGDPGTMIRELRDELAPMELTLALTYLYALFSLKAPDEAPGDRWPTLADDLLFARQFIMLVAAGEMQHARWVNQMLWEMARAGLFPAGQSYEPVLRHLPSMSVAGRKIELRPLEPQALDDFIKIERPGGTLDTAYARCVAEMRRRDGAGAHVYPRHLFELSVRIDSDGLNHYSRFRDIRSVFSAYGKGPDGYPYLRSLRQGTPAEAGKALELVRSILRSLDTAYRAEAADDLASAQAGIAAARGVMDELVREGDRLGRAGIGIPFWAAFDGQAA